MSHWNLAQFCVSLPRLYLGAPGVRRGAMLDPVSTAAEPLLQEAVPLSARCGVRILTLLFLPSVLGFAVLLSPVLLNWHVRGPHLPLQEPMDMAAVMARWPHWQQARPAPVSSFAGLQPRFPLQVESRQAAIVPQEISSALVPSIWSSGAGLGATAGHQRLQPLLGYAYDYQELPAAWDDGTLPETVTTNAGIEMPRLIFRTPFKQEATKDIIVSAILEGGAKGLDVVAPLKFYDYYEPVAGEALKVLFDSGVERESLFIQTQVNPLYAAELNPGESITRQIELSIANSLSQLGLKYLDSLILHSPYPLHEQTMEAWRAMEAAYNSGLVKQLGIGNVRVADILRKVYQQSTIKPAVIKHRWYTEADRIEKMKSREILRICAEQSIYTMSAFNTRNGPVARTRKNFNIGAVRWTMDSMAKKYGVTKDVIYFRWVQGLHGIPLIGSPLEADVRRALTARRVPLEKRDAESIEWLMT